MMSRGVGLCARGRRGVAAVGRASRTIGPRPWATVLSGVTLLYMGRTSAQRTCIWSARLRSTIPRNTALLLSVYAEDPRLSALCLSGLGAARCWLSRAGAGGIARSLTAARLGSSQHACAGACSRCCMVPASAPRRAGVVELAEALTSLATKQGFPLLAGYGHDPSGLGAACTGEPERGIDQIEAGPDHLPNHSGARTRAAILSWRSSPTSCRRAAPAGRGDLRPLADALEACPDRRALVQGGAVLARGETLLHTAARPWKAEASFRQALVSRAGAGSRLWELRAATSLARLWAEQGKRAAGPRPARADLRLVHRGLRHRRSQGRQGAARRASVSRVDRTLRSPPQSRRAAPACGAGPRRRGGRRTPRRRARRMRRRRPRA